MLNETQSVHLSRQTGIISAWTILARRELRPRAPCVRIPRAPMAFDPHWKLSSSANAGQDTLELNA